MHTAIFDDLKHLTKNDNKQLISSWNSADQLCIIIFPRWLQVVVNAALERFENKLLEQSNWIIQRSVTYDNCHIWQFLIFTHGKLMYEIPSVFRERGKGALAHLWKEKSNHRCLLASSISFHIVASCHF